MGVRWLSTIIFAVAMSAGALAEELLTKETVLSDAKLRLQLADCMTLPIGRIDIRPYSETTLAGSLSALEKAGVVAIKNADTSKGDVWHDLANLTGREMGEGDLDITLAPNVDRVQIR